MQLDFYYDVVCPYAYLASLQVEAVAERAGATLRWRPMLLGGVFRALGAPQVPAETWNPQKRALGELDQEREAARLGVRLRRPEAHPRRTVDAMRLAAVAPEALRPALSKALFHAYWGEGRDVSDPAVVASVARAHGLPDDAARSDAAREALFAATDAAVARGVFGAPSFGVGDRIWWGQDRLHLVEGALGGAMRSPGFAGPAVGGGLELFHDLSSPFSYLGSTQAPALAAALGVTLTWSPILLGALFRDIGTPNVPMLAMSGARQRYVAQDLQDWAAWWGVPFRFPDTFPLRTVTPLRVSALEPGAIAPMYRAAWADNQDIGQPEVLRGVLDAAGLDGAGLIEASASPAAKDALRASTERARALGVHGVPTFRLDDGRLFWGQDRLTRVAEALRG